MGIESADVCIALMANTVRFYAVKRMVTLFLINKECRWKYSGILFVTACLGTGLIYEIFKSPVCNVAANICMVLLIVFPYRAKAGIKILLVTAIYIVNITVDVLVVFSLAGHVIGKSFNQAYECIASLLILLISVILERGGFKKYKAELPEIYIAVLEIVPVISIACIWCLAIIDIKQDKMRNLVFIFLIWAMLVNIVIIYLYSVLTGFYSDKMEKKMFEQMVEVYARQLEMMQESQAYVNALRHDMKHHIIELSSMIKAKDNLEALNYLRNMEQFMLNPKEHVSTGNYEIDGILNYLLQDVESILNHVNVNISIQEKNDRKDFRTCVIIGNLVDNAVRKACESEEKYLDLTIKSKKGIMLIDIENSYSGEVIRQGNHFMSSQQTSAVHGIGLESVKRVVEMNGGDIKIDYAQGRFKVKVLLYLSNIE